MDCLYDVNAKNWSGPSVESIYNFNNSIGQILYYQLLNFANKVIQIDDTTNTTVTGQEALTWGIRIAQHLKSQQLNHNDVIGILARNTTYVLPTMLGCFFNCSPLHAVNPMLDEDTITHCYGLTQPKVIFCDGSDYAMLKRATEAYRPMIYTISEHIENVPSVLDLLEETESEKYYRPEKLSLKVNQTAAILCSSGTTGKPKAVCLSKSALLMNDRINTSESVLYLASGIDWITGLFFTISSCIRGFTRIIFNAKFEVDHFLELVAKYNISNAFLSSRYVAALVQHPRATCDSMSALRKILFGGSSLSEVSCKKLLELCRDDVKLFFGYGSTEMGLIALREGGDKFKSVGKLMDNLQLAIIDEDNQRLSHNKVGEIVVRNPNRWNGYYGNSSETASAVDSEGWFHTGDLGYMDDDNDLFIVDRKKEILKYQGIHFWPSEIEEVIAALPGIRDFCVVPVIDEMRGDVAGALVVKAKGCTLTEQDVVEHVKSRLVAPHKQLNAGVFFVDKLPQNPNGKLLKKEARDLLQEFVAKNKRVNG